jgi:mono/diheme cytochrome c family protein
MPGWKYALREDQIDAVVSYLKTIETPSRTVGVQPSEF